MGGLEAFGEPAISRGKERVAVFGECWRRWVSPGAKPIRATDPAALRVLELHRGDDPFQVETQLRTLWT